MKLHQMSRALFLIPTNLCAALHETPVHWASFGHRLEKRIVFFAKVHVEKPVRRKRPPALRAVVPMRRVVVSLVLPTGVENRVVTMATET